MNHRDMQRKLSEAGRRATAACAARLKRGLTSLLGLYLLALTPGCGQEQKKEVKLLTVPEEVLIARGGKVKLKATINIDAIPVGVDETKLTVIVKKPLPKGLRIKEGNNSMDIEFESKPDMESNSVVWTLLADPDAPVDEEAKLRVEVFAPKPAPGGVAGEAGKEGKHGVEVPANGESKLLAETEISVTIHDFTLSTGWPVMIVSVTTVLCLVGFCLWRVLTLPPVEVEEHLQGPLTIETPDMKEPE